MNFYQTISCCYFLFIIVIDSFYFVWNRWKIMCLKCQGRLFKNTHRLVFSFSVCTQTKTSYSLQHPHFTSSRSSKPKPLNEKQRKYNSINKRTPFTTRIKTRSDLRCKKYVSFPFSWPLPATLKPWPPAPAAVIEKKKKNKEKRNKQPIAWNYHQRNLKTGRKQPAPGSREREEAKWPGECKKGNGCEWEERKRETVWVISGIDGDREASERHWDVATPVTSDHPGRVPLPPPHSPSERGRTEGQAGGIVRLQYWGPRLPCDCAEHRCVAALLVQNGIRVTSFLKRKILNRPAIYFIEF